MSCASCARFNRYMDCFRPLKDSPKFKWEMNRNLIHVGSRKTRRTDMAKAATSNPKPYLATVTPDRKSTRLNTSQQCSPRIPSYALIIKKHNYQRKRKHIC